MNFYNKVIGGGRDTSTRRLRVPADPWGGSDPDRPEPIVGGDTRTRSTRRTPFTDGKKMNVFITEIFVMKYDGFLSILTIYNTVCEAAFGGRGPVIECVIMGEAYVDPMPKGPRGHLGRVRSGPTGGQ